MGMNNRIDAAQGVEGKSGNKYVDMYKKLQQYKDNFAQAASIAASGKGMFGPSIFTDTRQTGAPNL